MNCAVDIEFGVTEEGEVKILQTRAITTCFTWTDWELEHEFDTAVASDMEVHTRGNVGEVFNGALTPLTMSTVVKVSVPSPLVELSNCDIDINNIGNLPYQQLRIS